VIFVAAHAEEDQQVLAATKMPVIATAMRQSIARKISSAPPNAISGGVISIRMRWVSAWNEPVSAPTRCPSEPPRWFWKKPI
jgi:hypothetical protein